MSMPLAREIDKTAKCNRCGDEQLGWYKTKAGKWMLFHAYFIETHTVVNLAEPHFKECARFKDEVEKARRNMAQQNCTK